MSDVYLLARFKRGRVQNRERVKDATLRRVYSADCIAKLVFIPVATARGSVSCARDSELGLALDRS